VRPRPAPLILFVAATLSFAVAPAWAQEPARAAVSSSAVSSPAATTPTPGLPVAPPPALATPVLVAPPSTAAASSKVHVPLARRWWFWAGLGVAAAGIVVAGLALGPRSPYSGNAMPGVVPIP
jgi:hypothetical protein